MIYMLEEILHQLFVKTGHLQEEEGKQAKPAGHGHSHDNVQVVPTEEGIQVRFIKCLIWILKNDQINGRVSTHT